MPSSPRSETLGNAVQGIRAKPAATPALLQDFLRSPYLATALGADRHLQHPPTTTAAEHLVLVQPPVAGPRFYQLGHAPAARSHLLN